MQFWYLLIGILFVAVSCTNSVEVKPEIKSNKITKAEWEVYLGKKLFFDHRLSIDTTVSCATCHKPPMAFTDGKKFSDGVNGNLTERNSPTLFNLKNAPHFMWDGGIPTLEMQAIAPIENPLEMNLSIKELVQRLNNDTMYVRLSNEIYGHEVTPETITKSLAAYQRSLVAYSSKFDKFYAGEKNVYTEEERQGWKIFSEKLNCIKCHSLPDFTNYEVVQNGITPIKEIDLGRYKITGKKEDVGKFKTPTLRNIALTSPYMHDGSMNSLKEVIEEYSKGGNNHTNQDERIQKFDLTDKEISALISFLNSLTEDFYTKK